MTDCASGQQYELVRGDARAVIAELAGGLRLFARGAVALTETYADNEIAPGAAGLLLAPWGNRIADGRWLLHGAAQQLDVTEVGRSNAIHGLLRNTGYRRVDSDGSAVELAASIFPQHGYPFHLEHSVRYHIEEDLSLSVTQRLRNLGASAAPFGLAAHPYLLIGGVDTEDLTLTVSARTRLPANERMIPIGAEPVSGAYDLRSGVRVGDMELDMGYTDLDLHEGRHEHTLTAPDGRSVTLWAEEAFRFVQVFVTTDFPAKSRAVALEPMTAPADAFNSGNGLRWLEPGDWFTAQWGIRAELD